MTALGVADVTLVRLVVVGGGPSCTYTLERLAATVSNLGPGVALEIHIYDRSGRFGAGAVHSAHQPVTSYLNRIVGQVAFAADESIVGAGPLLPPEARPTLYEWCRRTFRETGDPAFDLRPEDWPKRYVHGLALQSMFDSYVRLLRGNDRVRVELHAEEVVDLVAHHDGLRVVTADGEDDLLGHHVLVVTGHSTNDPRRFPNRVHWVEAAAAGPSTFVSSAYPLEERLREDVATPDRVVGCVGTGLTAIDVILHLTEGRGGSFEDIGRGWLRYHPSGHEPAAVVVASSAGLFTFARPFNAKERDLARLEHRGVHFTEDAVDRLRANVGRPVTIGDIEQRQLDFEQHVFPLVVLEMAQVYYATLLGPEVGRRLAERVRPVVDRFLATGGEEIPGSIETLLAPLEAEIEALVELLDGVLDGRAAADTLPSWADAALRRFVTVVFGAAALPGIDALYADPTRLAAHVAGLDSPWRHEVRLAGNRFSWESTIHPVPAAAAETPEGYRAAVIDFMVRDHLWAAQNNVDNPAKAAADGVWRDLRPVLGHAVDFGGLAPASHRRFLDVYMRHHNRLANGAALEVMEKLLAVVEHGFVDVSAGPGAAVRTDGPDGRFVIEGPRTGARIPVDVLVDARVHPFDPEADTRPLYPALLRRGLVRTWCNPGAGDEPPFYPGGLDLTPEFHPVHADGTVDHRLTFLGPPSEGVMFFQLGALRPHQNHHVMQDILCWLGEFWEHVNAAGRTPVRTLDDGATRR